MSRLPEKELQELLRNFRDSVRSSVDQIREAEDELLLQMTDPEQMEVAILFVSSVIGRKEITMANNTTNIGSAGTVVTGGTSSGNIVGNLQQNMTTDVSKALAEIDALRQKLLASPALNEEQKQDSDAALQDVHTELQKEPGERNPSRIRMAMNMLASSVKLVDGAQHLYDSLGPHILSLLHHL